MRTVFDDIADVFVEDQTTNSLVADFEDLKRKNEDYLPLPGLRRFCDSHMKFRKVVVETVEDPMKVKIWFRGHDIRVSDIVKKKVKTEEKGITWGGRVNPPAKEEVTPQQEKIKDILDAPVKEDHAVKVPVKKRKKTVYSEAERKRRSDRMKQTIAERKVKLAKEKEDGEKTKV
jgi:hypothetical protein